MKSKIICNYICIFIIQLFLVLFVGCGKKSSPTEPTGNEWLSVSEEVNGTLTEMNGIPVLRVWGTNYEQGYANGYLTAPDIIDYLQNSLVGGLYGYNASTYENILASLNRMIIDQRYREEMQGMFDGIQARSDDPVIIPLLERELRLNDILTMNCALDFRPIMCSSFAAWGEMTSDGGTITGRNDDWPPISTLSSIKQLIVIHSFPSGSERLGFVSINTPGDIGCPTGMNAEGVTINRNAGNGSPSSAASSYYPRYLTYRTAIESAHAGTVVRDVKNVLEGRQTDGTIILMMSFPFTGNNKGSVVFEYDGNLSITNGVTVREPGASNSFQITTNHYRERRQPVDCERYTLLIGELNEIAVSGGTMHFTTEKAWNLLESVCAGGGLTLDSTVFEPNKKLMHVAFAENGVSAPSCRVVTLNVAELIE